MAVSTFVATAGVWLFVEWKPSRPTWAENSAEMVRYGLGIASGNFISFVVSNVSSVVIGKVFGGHLLGLYDRAAKLLASPLQQLVQPISGVVVPLLYRLHDDDERYRTTFLRTTGSLCVLITPGVIWAISSSEPLILFLLGAKWEETIPLFAALSLAALPQLLNGSAGWLFVTQGRAGDFAKWSLWSGLFSITCLFGGIPFGLLGVAISRVVYQVIATPFLWWFACRKGPVDLASVVTTLRPQLAGIATCALTMLAWANMVPTGLTSLIVGLFLAYATLLLTIFLFPAGRSAVKRDLQFGGLLVRQVVTRLAQFRVRKHNP